MILSIKVKTGFALKLPVFSKELVFKPGLNILFGPNGCGKTTALNIAAAYSAVKDRGWSQRPDPLDVRGFNENEYDFPACFSNMCVGKIKADVEWDGKPTHYSTSVGEAVVPRAFADDHDGMVDQLNVMLAKPSSGQLRLHNMAKTIHGLKPPDLFAWNDKGINDIWQSCYKAFCDYLLTLPRNGQVTLLLDEPDRSLSLPVQFDLWTKGIPQWAKHMQVIVAAHSPFCLAIPNCNLIECVNGYVEDCRKCLKEAFGGMLSVYNNEHKMDNHTAKSI